MIVKLVSESTPNKYAFHYIVILCFSAIEHGTEMLEIDVNLTADGQVVVSHDNELVRTTGHGGMISDFAYEVNTQNFMSNMPKLILRKIDHLRLIFCISTV